MTLNFRLAWKVLPFVRNTMYHVFFPSIAIATPQIYSHFLLLSHKQIKSIVLLYTSIYSDTYSDVISSDLSWNISDSGTYYRMTTRIDILARFLYWQTRKYRHNTSLSYFRDTVEDVVDWVSSVRISLHCLSSRSFGRILFPRSMPHPVDIARIKFKYSLICWLLYLTLLCLSNVWSPIFPQFICIRWVD